MRLAALSVCGLLACASKSSKPEQTGSQTPTDGSQASSSAGLDDAATTTPTKRPPPPPLTQDTRGIDHSKFSLLNPYHPQHGVIHASEDGGCHVYVRSKSAPRRPPGSFPPATPVPCPPEMLQPEWGHCTGPGTISATAAKDECICQPGAGDPPGPAFRQPCPK